jgi:hypothetical protein
MSSPTSEPRLILSDSWGIYIPQMFVSDIGDDEAQTLGINLWALKQCQTGPDAPHYWEAWDEILRDCELRDEAGTVWRLYQNGDLWEIPDGFCFPEDF